MRSVAYAAETGLARVRRRAIDARLARRRQDRKRRNRYCGDARHGRLVTARSRVVVLRGRRPEAFVTLTSWVAVHGYALAVRAAVEPFASRHEKRSHGAA